MCKSFRNFKGIIKKIVCAILIGCILITSSPNISYAEPSGLGKLIGGVSKGLVKTSVFMVKEKQRQDKKVEQQVKKEQKIKDSEDKIQERKDIFENSKDKLSHEDLIGLSNLVDNMIDGYAKDVTDLTRKQLESRVKLRLTNKKLTQKHHKDLKDYIDKKATINSITGKNGIYVSPSGVGFTTAPVPALAY